MGPAPSRPGWTSVSHPSSPTRRPLRTATPSLSGSPAALRRRVRPETAPDPGAKAPAEASAPGRRYSPAIAVGRCLRRCCSFADARRSERDHLSDPDRYGIGPATRPDGPRCSPIAAAPPTSGRVGRRFGSRLVGLGHGSSLTVPYNHGPKPHVGGPITPAAAVPTVLIGGMPAAVANTIPVESPACPRRRTGSRWAA